MKRLCIILIICVMLLGGCGSKTSSTNPPQNSNELSLNTQGGTPNEATPTLEGDTVVIKEKLFIAQLNDVYLNQDAYLGKTIKFEGMFTQYTWDEKGLTYYLVYRNSPGCCGADGQAGFEVKWQDRTNKTYPGENDWVEAVGVLEEYENDGYKYLRIVLSSLTVQTKRGAEFVSQ